MTTNLWVEQVSPDFRNRLKKKKTNNRDGVTLLFLQYWYDYKLTWEPSEYGGVNMLHVPSDHIWRPDISLYNK